MDTTLAILAFLFALIGIAGCIVPALPGVILSYAGLVCAYFCSYSQISTAALLIWLAVTLFVSVADYFLPAYMTRRFGGSRAGAIGATIGTVVGFFFIPPLGILLGPFVGAVIGELCHNREDISRPSSSASARSFRSSSARGSSSLLPWACSYISPPTPIRSCGSGSPPFSKPNHR